MKQEITIGSVKMPLADFVVSRNAILGITKSGKTYTAKGIAEQLIEKHIPIIVFDAIGVWRYLKVAGEGHHAKGYPMVVAGGEHPDLPLTPKGAPEIVRAAIKENVPLIIDLYDSKLSKADWRRIVQACFRVLLYENKGLRHIFLEEASEFAPQKVMDGETYAEVEKLARMGGNKHVGITFINQRAQELNKAVLELCDNVVLLRQRGSHAIDALEKWLDRLSPDMAKKIAGSMPHMTQGDCWIFTENDEEPVRTRSSTINSLHPDRRMPEQALNEKKSVNADAFVKQLSAELSKLLEEQKENDPAALKDRIRKLEMELKSKPVSQQIKEVSVLTDKDRDELRYLTAIYDRLTERFEDVCSGLDEAKSKVFQLTEVLHKPTPSPTIKLRTDNLPRWKPDVRADVTEMNARDTSLGRCERSILIALAQHHPRKRTAVQVAILTGYSSKSGGFNNALSKLRSLGYIDHGQPIGITATGLYALGTYEALPTGPDLRLYWLRKLGKCEGAILQALIENHPNGLNSHDIAGMTGYQPSSGGFNNALSRLRTLELINRGQPIKASDDLF